MWGPALFAALAPGAPPWPPEPEVARGPMGAKEQGTAANPELFAPGWLPGAPVPSWLTSWLGGPSTTAFLPKALTQSQEVSMSHRKLVLEVKLEYGLRASCSRSSMPTWPPFCACQEGTAVARTISILALKVDPFQPAALPGSTA